MNISKVSNHLKKILIISSLVITTSAMANQNMGNNEISQNNALSNISKLEQMVKDNKTIPQKNILHDEISVENMASILESSIYYKDFNKEQATLTFIRDHIKDCVKLVKQLKDDVKNEINSETRTDNINLSFYAMQLEDILAEIQTSTKGLESIFEKNKDKYKLELEVIKKFEVMGTFLDLSKQIKTQLDEKELQVKLDILETDIQKINEQNISHINHNNMHELLDEAIYSENNDEINNINKFIDKNIISESELLQDVLINVELALFDVDNEDIDSREDLYKAISKLEASNAITNNKYHEVYVMLKSEELGFNNKKLESFHKQQSDIFNYMEEMYQKTGKRVLNKDDFKKIETFVKTKVIELNKITKEQKVSSKKQKSQSSQKM